jgi:hypothetical protein
MDTCPNITIENNHGHDVKRIIRENPEIVGFQLYEKFRPSNPEAARDDFLSGKVDVPRLALDNLSSEEISTLGRDATEVLRLLLGQDMTIGQNSTLYEAIEYRLSEIALADISRIINDDTADESTKQEALAWFRATNEALYGAPEKEVFSTIAHKKLFPLMSLRCEEGSLAHDLKKDIQGRLGSIEESSYSIYVASDETVHTIQKLITERFGYLIEHVDDEAEYSPEGIAEAMTEVLKKLDSSNELGWSVELVENSSSLAVSAHQKVVEIGAQRKTIMGIDLKGKILHEVGIHAQRSMLAEHAGWVSATYGMDGYLVFEEGAATALEDAFHGKYVEHGDNYYFMAGLAYGQDNHEPRDFSEVFEIMWRINALKKIQAGNDDIDIEEIRKTTYNSVMRIFRGSRMIDKGIVYLKDLAYFKGQELAWSFLDGVKNQDDLQMLFCGKVDLTRADHRDVAKKIKESTP